MTAFDIAEADRLLKTTRAVRKRLDLERPVEESVIRECLEITQQAPTGSNKQGWRWIVVTDADKRRSLAEFYRKGAGGYLEKAQADAVARGAAQDGRVYASARYLADRLQDVPVHVIPCIRVDHLPDDPPARVWPGVRRALQSIAAWMVASERRMRAS